VETALERIAERGFDEYSLDEVAEAVDVSRNLLYRYFARGRQDLSLAVVERVMGALGQHLVVDPTLELERRVEINLGPFAAQGFAGTAEWRVYRRIRAVTDPEAVALIEDFHSRWVALIAANNRVNPSDEIVAAGLRSMIAFACEAIDQAAARGIEQPVVMELIVGGFEDTLARCVARQQTKRARRRTP